MKKFVTVVLACTGAFLICAGLRAAGDALGYAVEFDLESEIFSRYGDAGITEYELDRASGKALISDDTQMTLFTANGILVGETRLCTRGIGGAPHMYMLRSYQDWLKTQDDSYVDQGRISWLLDVPQLHNRRAPGNTCLSALYESDNGKYCESYVESRINDSKGCGAVMRVAPLGIHYKDVPVETLMEEAAEISAITHGHELGYMPSAALPSISTGRKGYPVNEAARVAVSAVINFVEGHPDAFDEIVWIVGSDHDQEAYENQIGLAVVSKLVSSSSLNAINDILRNGKLM